MFFYYSNVGIFLNSHHFYQQFGGWLFQKINTKLTPKPPKIEPKPDKNPEFSKMGKWGLGHLMITAPSVSDNEDFVVRCFAPDLGVDEDPVTGSAHCALTPLWANKLGKLELKSKQISKRTGELFLKLIGDRVEIKGRAVTVFEARLK